MKLNNNILILLFILLFMLLSFWFIGKWKFDTAQLAIIISVISLSLAGAAFWWNIYSHFYSKARLGIRLILTISCKSRFDRCFGLSIVNFGPDEILLYRVALRRKYSFFKRSETDKYSFVNEYANDLEPDFPIKLKKGETKYIQLKVDTVLQFECFVQVGILDSYGRYTWAPKKDFKKVKNYPDLEDY